MPEQTGPGPKPRYLPPVFTQWTGPAATAHPDMPAVPPFVPDGGTLPDVVATNGLDADAARPGLDTASADLHGMAPDADVLAFPGETASPLTLQPATSDELPALDAPLAAATPDPAVAELADRLERLAARLRSGGAAALGPGVTGTDRLDAVLTGLLAGYLAGRNG